MGYKSLSVIEVSEISAVTGIGNILEAKKCIGNDIILVLRMEDEDFVSLHNLDRVAEYFDVSKNDIVLNGTSKGNLEISIMGTSSFSKDEEPDGPPNKVSYINTMSDDDWLPIIEETASAFDNELKKWDLTGYGTKKDGLIGCCGAGGCVGCPSRKD